MKSFEMYIGNITKEGIEYKVYLTPSKEQYHPPEATSCEDFNLGLNIGEDWDDISKEYLEAWVSLIDTLYHNLKPKDSPNIR